MLLVVNYDCYAIILNVRDKTNTARIILSTSQTASASLPQKQHTTKIFRDFSPISGFSDENIAIMLSSSLNDLMKHARPQLWI